MKDLILAGIQASGKGTQAQKLLEKYGEQIAYFETGNILRALTSNNNAIGVYIRNIIDRGHLLKDEIIIGLFSLFLETVGEKSILGDGSFRRIGQTKGILEVLAKKGRKPLIIQLEIPEDEVYKRLSARKTCKKCGWIHNTHLDGERATCKKCGGDLYVRTDDADKQAIAIRIAEYKNETIPALEYADQLGLLVKINGMQPIDVIFKQIEELL